MFHFRLGDIIHVFDGSPRAWPQFKDEIFVASVALGLTGFGDDDSDDDDLGPSLRAEVQVSPLKTTIVSPAKPTTRTRSQSKLTSSGIGETFKQPVSDAAHFGI